MSSPEKEGIRLNANCESIPRVCHVPWENTFLHHSLKQIQSISLFLSMRSQSLEERIRLPQAAIITYIYVSQTRTDPLLGTKVESQRYLMCNNKKESVGGLYATFIEHTCNIMRNNNFHIKPMRQCICCCYFMFFY